MYEQEFLRLRNRPPQIEDPAPASLWHEMQQRDAPGSSSCSDAEDYPGPIHTSWGPPNGGGLFDSMDAPAPMPKPGAPSWRPAQPVQGSLLRLDSSTMPCEPSQQPPQLGFSAAGPVSTTALSATGQSACAPAGNQKNSNDGSDLGSKGQEAADSRLPGTADLESGEQQREQQPLQQQAILAGGGSRHRFSSSGERSEASNSMVGNLISTVRSGISAISRVMAALPPSLRCAAAKNLQSASFECLCLTICSIS